MSSADIEAAAATWFARCESGDWSVADQAQLDAWLDAATAHRIAFIRIVTAWERAGRLTALGAGVPAGTIPPRDAWVFSPAAANPASRVTAVVEHTTRPLFSRRLRTIAAMLLAAAVGVFSWYGLTGHTQAYRTPIGGLSTVPLSDGSRMTLNTDSEVHVALDPALRRIRLDQGEAFFDVYKDTARPFVVDIGDARVVAVGTQFSVRRDHDDVRVLVTEGQVSLQHRTNPQQTLLPAGSEARLSATSLHIEQLSASELERLSSWRTGRLVFDNTALIDAVADFNRYSVRKIVIADPSIAGIRIGGNFRSGDAAAFLWLLQNGFPIHVEQSNDRIVLTRR